MKRRRATKKWGGNRRKRNGTTRTGNKGVENVEIEWESYEMGEILSGIQTSYRGENIVEVGVY